MLPQPLRLKISNELSFARGERGGYVVVSGSNYVHTCRDSGAQSTNIFLDDCLACPAPSPTRVILRFCGWGIRSPANASLGTEGGRLDDRLEIVSLGRWAPGFGVDFGRSCVHGAAYVRGLAATREPIEITPAFVRQNSISRAIEFSKPRGCECFWGLFSGSRARGKQ